MKKHKYILLTLAFITFIFAFKHVQLKANADSNNVYDLSEHQGVFTDSQVQNLKKTKYHLSF